ncbi:hypothetical protein ACL02T_17885 [Pseudonocardia sp. RS010]|uniref:hypothetical protein n=1 Tax=Pseudonocardia sp. RS010 TaxID=3385979 RepID=UPI00399FBAD9
MSVQLKPGVRIYSTACSTELIAVKVPAGELDLKIGGLDAVTAPPADRADVQDGFGGGTQMGKRYRDESGTIELLCIKAGDGVPTLDGATLTVGEPKLLPSSD